MSLEDEIQKSVELLKKGKVILYPTDTIWGIGCDATNTKAVQKIYKIKQRTESKSLILLLDSIEKLSNYVERVPTITTELINHSASPLTIVYSGAKNISKNLIAKDGSIAIRIVKGEYCSKVIKRLGKPLVSTSANLSDQATPRHFEEISDDIKSKVDYVVDIFRDRIQGMKPSTIIRIEENGNFEILRQ
ncbi:MAG: threonylcarbamoyl-AMP synthase [Chlorobi bacterium]|nr:threonylcarbamoyl-AMP synthase [Chlorobiota bacterium]